MTNFQLTVNAVVPMFLLIAVGYLSRRLGALSREEVPRVNRLAFRIFLPVQLFYNVYQSNPGSSLNGRLILYAVVGVLLVAGLSILGVKRLVRRQDWRGVISQGIFRSNFVILGLPIAQALLPGDQLGPVTILIAIVVPLFNFLAVSVLEGFRRGRVKTGEVLLEIAKNPLVIGSLIGILFRLLHLRLPALLEQTAASIGSIATPLQLFLLGAFFRFDGLLRYGKPLAAVTVIKLFVTPAVFLTLGYLLGFRGAAFVGLMGVFASPTAVNSFTMVQQMKCGDEELAGDIVVSTSAGSMFSFFLWILLFKTLGAF
ncbi:MAG: AEC family transporter [Oscillospiraceae bacterium]|nr:AEC family transporter [Oscillospiraceae bacterium]